MGRKKPLKLRLNNIIFVSGKGKIFFSNQFRIDELDKLSFKEIDTNIEISYDDDLTVNVITNIYNI